MVAFSPDRKLLASGSTDNTVRLWDVGSRQPLALPLAPHKSRVTSVAFSPDGKLLASGGGDGSVRLWEVASGRQFGRSFSGHSGAVNSVAFSPDLKLLPSPATMGFDSGTLTPASRPHRSRATPEPSTPSHSALTAQCWQAPATTRRCGCRSCRQAGSSRPVSWSAAILRGRSGTSSWGAAGPMSATATCHRVGMPLPGPQQPGTLHGRSALNDGSRKGRGL